MNHDPNGKKEAKDKPTKARPKENYIDTPKSVISGIGPVCNKNLVMTSI